MFDDSICYLNNRFKNKQDVFIIKELMHEENIICTSKNLFI